MKLSEQQVETITEKANALGEALVQKFAPTSTPTMERRTPRPITSAQAIEDMVVDMPFPITNGHTYRVLTGLPVGFWMGRATPLRWEGEYQLLATDSKAALAAMMRRAMAHGYAMTIFGADHNIIWEN